MQAVIVGDTAGLAFRAQEVLCPKGYRVVSTDSLEQFKGAIATSHPKDLVIAVLLDDAMSFQVWEVLRKAEFLGSLLVLVEHLAHPGAAPLLQFPRSQSVVLPPSRAALDAFLNHVAEWHEPVRNRPTVTTFHGMVGQSRAMLDIFSRLEKIAACDANVCIYGESGTGKELVSRAIHLASPRRDHPLAILDCTAIPDGLIESHLFGHVKGAFTGATDPRDGVFSLANMGTLFIDELSELPLPLQTKLLRVIQTREFTKVGGTKPLRSNIRLVTAMNKDPKRSVEEGRFREDLYYRVAVVMLRMPPLRERKEDIPLLVEHFLRRLSAAYRRRSVTIAPKALDRMVEFNWPGNVRQLENFIEQAFVLSDSDVLTERDLFESEQRTVPPPGLTRVQERAVQWPRPPSLFHVPSPASIRPAPSVRLPFNGASEIAGNGAQSAPDDFEPGLPLHEVERRYILRTLQEVRGNRTEAAKRLGIGLRTLQYKLKAYLKEPGQGEAHELTGTLSDSTDLKIS